MHGQSPGCLEATSQQHQSCSSTTPDSYNRLRSRVADIPMVYIRSPIIQLIVNKFRVINNCTFDLSSDVRNTTLGHSFAPAKCI